MSKFKYLCAETKKMAFEIISSIDNNKFVILCLEDMQDPEPHIKDGKLNVILTLYK